MLSVTTFELSTSNHNVEDDVKSERVVKSEETVIEISGSKTTI